MWAGLSNSLPKKTAWKNSNCAVEVIEGTGHIFETMTIIVQRKRGAKLEMNRGAVLSNSLTWRNTVYRHTVVSSRRML